MLTKLQLEALEKHRREQMYTGGLRRAQARRLLRKNLDRQYVANKCGYKNVDSMMRAVRSYEKARKGAKANA